MSWGNYKKLEKFLRRTYGNAAPLIFLHPDEDRDYTEDEYDNLKERDFVTRWLLCGTSVVGKSVILRTHFTDNHQFESDLRMIRDYFFKAISPQNHTTTKHAVTEILNDLLDMSSDQYHSLVVTVASGLSNYAENTTVELQHEILTHPEVDLARQKFCLLMNVLFTNLSTYKFLMKDGGRNTYRLIHCETFSSLDKRPLIYAFFGFSIQLGLTVYVVLEFVGTNEYSGLKNLPLALLTFIYSIALAYPEHSKTRKAMEFYRKIGWLQVLDLFVNQFLAYVLLIAGCFAIFLQKTFMEAVVCTAALFFVRQIDDQIPKIRGMKEDLIVKNHLRYQTIKDFNKVIKMDDAAIQVHLQRKKYESIGVQFCDYYLTNSREQTASTKHHFTFNPHQIRDEMDGTGPQINSSDIITRNCLIRKLEWSYTMGSACTHSSTPRIGLLRMHLLGSDQVVELFRKVFVDDGIRVSNTTHKLEGVFMITIFQMSNDISKLRVCGSANAEDFLNAVDYYSLWDLTAGARKLLKKEAAKNSYQEVRGPKAGGTYDVEKGNDTMYQYYRFGDEKVHSDISGQLPGVVNNADVSKDYTSEDTMSVESSNEFVNIAQTETFSSAGSVTSGIMYTRSEDGNYNLLTRTIQNIRGNVEDNAETNVDHNTP